MATQRVTPPWNYLHEASDTSLESFELSRLNHAANLRKEITALLEQWIEVTAEAFLARWIREDRKLAPEPCQGPDVLPQAELSFSPAKVINAGPRPVRRLRSRIRAGDRTSA